MEVAVLEAGREGSVVAEGGSLAARAEVAKRMVKEARVVVVMAVARATVKEEGAQVVATEVVVCMAAA